MAKRVLCLSDTGYSTRRRGGLTAGLGVIGAAVAKPLAAASSTQYWNNLERVLLRGQPPLNRVN